MPNIGNLNETALSRTLIRTHFTTVSLKLMFLGTTYCLSDNMVTLLRGPKHLLFSHLLVNGYFNLASFLLGNAIL